MPYSAKIQIIFLLRLIVAICSIEFPAKSFMESMVFLGRVYLYKSSFTRTVWFFATAKRNLFCIRLNAQPGLWCSLSWLWLLLLIGFLTNEYIILFSIVYMQSDSWICSFNPEKSKLCVITEFYNFSLFFFLVSRNY